MVARLIGCCQSWWLLWGLSACVGFCYAVLYMDFCTEKVVNWGGGDGFESHPNLQALDVLWGKMKGLWWIGAGRASALSCKGHHGGWQTCQHFYINHHRIQYQTWCCTGRSRTCQIMSYLQEIFEATSCVAFTNNSQCRMEYQKGRAGLIISDVPKIIKFTSQSTPSQNRVGNNVFQWIQGMQQRKLLVGICVWIIHVWKWMHVWRKSRRTTIVAHRSACFGQDNTIREDSISPSDVSTIVMESVTPLQDQYWCRVDEFMESGDKSSLSLSLDSDDDVEIANGSSAY